MELMTKAEYARRHGVSRAAVAKWVKLKWLRLLDGQIEVERSDARLKVYRPDVCPPPAGVVVKVRRGRPPVKESVNRAPIIG